MQEEMNKLKELHESLEMNYSDYNLVVAWSKLDEFENLVSSIRRNHEIEKLNINLNLWISDIRNLKNKYRALKFGFNNSSDINDTVFRNFTGEIKSQIEIFNMELKNID